MKRFYARTLLPFLESAQILPVQIPSLIHLTCLEEELISYTCASGKMAKKLTPPLTLSPFSQLPIDKFKPALSKYSFISYAISDYRFTNTVQRNGLRRRYN